MLETGCLKKRRDKVKTISGCFDPRRALQYACFLVVAVLMVAGCALVETAPYPEDSDTDKRVLTIWALSDIHPRFKSERKYFEETVDDANTLGPVEVGIIAGDLLKSRSRDEAFDWFLETRSRSTVQNWFEIAGNHDARSQPLFQHFFPNPPYYAVSIGNILILMLSDVSKKSRTDISDAGFAWWKKMVEENQDKIIITVTHAQLAESELFSSFLSSRVIAGSERFADVLKEKRVALWLSGHSHLPHGLSGTIAVNKNLNDTCFINVSSISRDSLLDSQSRFLLFTQGERKIWIRSRNHSKKQFESRLNIPLFMQKPFEWDGSGPKLILPAQ